MIRNYLLENYSYSFEPESLVTEFSTKNRRQRALYQKRDTVFNVSEKLNLSELSEFEEWVNVTLNNGSSSFTGAYYDGDTRKTATMYIVDGYYTFEHLSKNDVTVSYQVYVENRDMSDAENVYNLALNGPFDSEYYNLFSRVINNNNFSL